MFDVAVHYLFCLESHLKNSSSYDVMIIIYLDLLYIQNLLSIQQSSSY
jgi:hypothetical protein